MNKNGFVDYIIDLFSNFGHITKRYMFGGHGLYFNNNIFAIIADDELYLKADKPAAEYFHKFGSHPFTYQKGNKTISMCYWYVPIEIIEDIDSLKDWFNKSVGIN